ncbi:MULTISPECIES: 2'-5' RNA ligase family protein [unclassified Roseateles]|uniref:2'-5' RNA ligase family protein n=1 Tax=unclassified Roseateles TaxID=2626991 RepID=UPI0006F9A6A0|nr:MULTISPECIES: hypothetical protein [unclassified Roseateles]KQW48197.1 hypothetical protein ASC81_26285 [Pelomonas sp. Root405]KRA75379.1 hypothetical protein ASD88_26265 [Pelomonas sp. Root662]
MTVPRYLFVALPPQAVVDALKTFLDDQGLTSQLGGTMFQPFNWHQSLSGQFWQTAGIEAKLRAAGELLSARQVEFQMNRIVGRGTHWEFKPFGNPPGFTDLLAAVQAALRAVGVSDRGGHSPHMTVSYWAPTALRSVKIGPPIRWTIDTVSLVCGMADQSGYRYELVRQWPLHAAAPKAQHELFPDEGN